MKDGDKELVLKAQKSLKLRDIKLFNCKLERNEAGGEQTRPGPLKEQLKRGASYTKAQKKLGEKEITVLLVRVDLGIRVGSEVEDDGFQPLFIIEADYIVEYQLKEEIGDEALAVFAKYNGVHNVWPFWRQHVFDTVGKARLPHVPIPFFPGEDL